MTIVPAPLEPVAMLAIIALGCLTDPKIQAPLYHAVMYLDTRNRGQGSGREVMH